MKLLGHPAPDNEIRIYHLSKKQKKYVPLINPATVAIVAVKNTQVQTVTAANTRLLSDPSIALPILITI
jgi:hypothetical protein